MDHQHLAMSVDNGYGSGFVATCEGNNDIGKKYNFIIIYILYFISHPVP